MKKIFTFVLLISSIFYCNLSAIGVSLGFLGQFGMSGAIADSSAIFPSSFRDFDMGYSFLVGIRNNVTDNTGISILADIGYYHDSYALKYDINGKRATESYQFDSFMIGGMFKFHFFFISLSGGGGVKIPISGTYRLENSSLEYGYKDENMVLACIRGFEKQEVEFLKNHTKIDVFKAKDIQLLGAKNFVNLMKNKFLNEKYEIYLSYDIDANDPAYAPGTGTPEAFGLTSLTILEIVTGLIKELNVRALDIVEVAPPLDVNNITSWLALKTIYEVFYTLQNKNI